MTDTMTAPEATRGDVDDWLECITQDPNEPADSEFLEVCTVKADLIAESVNCTEANCGGHPVCRPCYDLAVEIGRILP